MSATLDEITLIANDRRLKPGPKAGLIWAKVNYTQPPTGMQLATGMGVCRNTAEGWLTAWERYSYLFRLPSQASDGTWSWRRHYIERIGAGQTDAQKVSINSNSSTSTKKRRRRKRVVPLPTAGGSTSPSEERSDERAVNAQKVSIGVTSDDAPELDLEDLKQRTERLLAAYATEAR